MCVCVVYLCSTLQPTRDGTLGVMGEGAHHDVWRPPRDTKVNTAVRRVCTVHQAGQSSDEHFIRFVCVCVGGGEYKNWRPSEDTRVTTAVIKVPDLVAWKIQKLFFVLKSVWIFFICWVV